MALSISPIEEQLYTVLPKSHEIETHIELFVPHPLSSIESKDMLVEEDQIPFEATTTHQDPTKKNDNDY